MINFDEERLKVDVIENARKYRRKFLRYNDAEVIYSMQHKKLMELADRAGAIYRVDGQVLINRIIFDEFLEQFRQEPLTKGKANHPVNRWQK